MRKVNSSWLTPTGEHHHGCIQFYNWVHQNDEHTEYLQSICTIVNMQNTNLNTDDFIKYKSYYQGHL